MRILYQGSLLLQKIDPIYLPLLLVIGLHAHWTARELEAFQMSDPDLLKVITWVKSNSMPTTFPRQESFVVQTLWNQRSSLVYQDNVLQQRWEDIPRGRLQPHLQLVLPRKLIPFALKSLHDHHFCWPPWYSKNVPENSISFLLAGTKKDGGRMV